MRALSNQNGSALLIALAIMAMLTIIGVVALDRSNTDIDLSYNQLRDDQSFYTAEAGIKRALAKLSDNSDWDTGFASVPMGDGIYSVVVIDSSLQFALDDTVIVRATGSVRDASTQIEAWLVPEINQPFRYALFGDSSVDMRNSALTDSYRSDSGSYATTVLFSYGDIGSNGIIEVHMSADLGGDVSTSSEGDLFIHIGSTIAGDTTSTAPEQTVPEIPDQEFIDAAAANDNLTGISGTYTYDPVYDSLVATGTMVLQTGTYYFSSVILKNSASLELAPGAEVVVYVTGNIELKNSSEVNVGGAPADLQFYTQGDIVLKNSGDIYATFYSPDGFGDLRNSGDFYGSIVAQNILVHNSAGFHYDRTLADIYKWTTGDLVLVAWREL